MSFDGPVGRGHVDAIWERFCVLEVHAALNGLEIKFDYAARQNGRDCWFIATDDQLRRCGLQLPNGWGIPPELISPTRPPPAAKQ